jgi:TPR repeat protein
MMTVCCKLLVRCRVLLALLLLPGTVTGQDVTPVLDWQVLLADPDPVELADLASQYEHAIGYRRDYGRARQLYCAAARLGYMQAQLRLAWMYANGLGAPRDTDLAGAWLQVAAANGDLQARKFLAYVGEPGVTRKPRCTYESRDRIEFRSTGPLPSECTGADAVDPVDRGPFRCQGQNRPGAKSAWRDGLYALVVILFSG